jgi:HCOMODA/2-hydroxy-3-carboxy-muconic semialdehyde decarboxylase
LPNSLADLRRDLAAAYRMVANEGILDAFGHISLRHPDNPNRYFLSRSLAPALVQAEDIQEYDLDSNPVVQSSVRPYVERVIHGEIFKARPDVNAVCHHHAPSIMPFAISGAPLLPVFHLGASMGGPAPFWDSRHDFGDTNLLVAKPEEGASMARAMGKHNIVLLRRHGATVAGANLRELVFATIYSARNAEYQLAAQVLGNVSPLTAGETAMAAEIHRNIGPLTRAYEVWERRLAEKEGRPAGAPPRGTMTAAAKPKAAAKKSKPPAKKAVNKAASKKSKGGKKR